MKEPRKPAEPVQRLAAAILTIALGGGLAGWTGCQRAEGPTSGEPARADLTSAQEVLDAMAAAYKKAERYSDHGVLRLAMTVNGEKQERTAPYSVVWEGPNKLRMHALRGVVVCDGKQFHAHFLDMVGQLARRPAPAQVTVPDLLSDTIFKSAISEGAPAQFSLVPPQLLLLSAKDPLKTIRYRSKEATLLTPEKIGQVECYRVELDRPDGKAVLWIDRGSLILRRIELPIEQMRKEAAEDKVDVQSWVADFQDAQFDGAIDEDQFRIDVPAAIQPVDYLTPPPLLPLGKPAPAFRFVGRDNKPVDRSAVQGKVAVLEFWATFCDPCRMTMPLLEKVYQKYKDNPKVVFLAVSVDDKTTLDKDLEAKMGQWQATVPIVRDPDQDASKKFGIRPIPAMHLIGQNGTVQDYAEGFRPSLDVDLSAKIEKLLAGEDISREALRRWDEDRKQDAASLEASGNRELYVLSAPEVPEPPKVKIAEPTKPKAFTLTPLWKCSDVNNPGNLLVVPQPNGPPKLLVIDDMKSVVEVGPDGKRKTLYPLDVRPEEIVTLLRTATDSGGKRYFLGAGLGCPRVHVFDENWRRLLSIPEAPPEGQQLQVADAQWADLDGDGKPEILVSYFSGGGVQCFSLDGKELWRNQEMKQVPRVAVVRDAAGAAIVLCASERGVLFALDAKGKRLGNFGPERMFITIVAAGLDGDQKLEMCGLFLLPDSTARVAAVVGPKGEEKQTFTLPKGLLPGWIEQIVPGNLSTSGPGCWLLPGADGSIHVMAPDGQLVEQFNSGSLLTGLATLVLDGRAVLVVAGNRGLEAYQVQWPQKPN